MLLSTNSIMTYAGAGGGDQVAGCAGVEFELSFQVGTLLGGATAKHEVYDLVYRHARAAGLGLAQPKESIMVGYYPTAAPPVRRRRHGAPADRGCSAVRFA